MFFEISKPLRNRKNAIFQGWSAFIRPTTAHLRFQIYICLISEYLGTAAVKNK